MKKRLILGIVGFLIAFCLLSGCDYITGAAISNNLPPATSTMMPTGIFSVTDEAIAAGNRPGAGVSGSVRSKDGESLYMSKKTSFPDGAILQTQFYKDDQPEPWWPAGTTIRVQGDFWEVALRLGVNGVPYFFETGPFYKLEVWEASNPSVKEMMGFDLVGPPAIP